MDYSNILNITFLIKKDFQFIQKYFSTINKLVFLLKSFFKNNTFYYYSFPVLFLSFVYFIDIKKKSLKKKKNQ